MVLSYDLFGVSPASFDPGRTFVRSDFLSTVTLASIRAVLSLYCFTTIIVGYTWQAYNLSYLELQDINVPEYLVIANGKAIGRSFSYFTWICFWSQAFYFLISSIHGFCLARQGHTWLHNRFLPPFQLLHSLWYTTVTTFPFLVSTVFWGTMTGAWPTGRYEQWLNLSVHGLNSLFALLEIWLPSIGRSPISHLAVLLVLLSLYLGLAYLTKLTENFYVYEWLNPAHGNLSIVLHILGYTGGIITIFALVSLMQVFKGRLSKRFARKEVADDGDSWDSRFDVVVEMQKPLPRAHMV